MEMQIRSMSMITGRIRHSLWTVIMYSANLVLCRMHMRNIKTWLAVHGGPACIETFGEEPFAPVSTEGAWALNEAQQKMQVELDN